MRSLRILLITLVAALGLVVAPTAAAQQISTPERTQIAVHFDGGHTVATANAGEQRPILSLSKLHLGYWVLHHGSQADKDRVQHMIAFSDDTIASELDDRYPQAIPEVIRDFGLHQTTYSGYWGSSHTSAHDAARFISEIRHDPVARPVIDGMRYAAPVAADGYRQDFGTAVLPGAQGTKFGWSNNRDIHATVTFGPGWVAAANTYGSAADHTADVRAAAGVLGSSVPGAPAAPSVPGSSGGTVTSGELLDRASCIDPLGSSQHLPQDIPVPGEVAQFVPAC